MKRTTFLLFLLLLTGASLVLAASFQSAPKGYKLVWSDDFNQAVGSAPDPSKWTYDLGAGGWGNEELETYTKLTQNASIVSDPMAQDGKALRIKAMRDENGAYTSARLKTQGKFTFKYGWVECRAKLPYGQGMWPAFWMLGEDITKVGWPACGEADIMEAIGKEPSTNHGTLHGPGYSGDKGLTSTYQLPQNAKLKDAYHIFAIEWTPKQISFYVDGILYKTRTPQDVPLGKKWVYDHPFFLILNLAVGGDWPGNPDETTKFPQTLMVDYVRVYQLSK